MSEVSRARPSDEVTARLDELDLQLGGSGVFSQIATFSQKLASRYLMSAGDFVCGLQYVIDPKTNLYFSSASLARSACEFANRGSWMAQPDISDEQRIARAIAIWQNTLQEERGVLEPEALTALQRVNSDIDRWRNERSFRETAGRPDPTRLFELIDPARGKDVYKHLCNATHGSLLALLAGQISAIHRDEEGTSETWWRVLIACQYGLEAARRVNLLLGVQPPAGLVYCWELTEHFLAIFEAREGADRS